MMMFAIALTLAGKSDAEFIRGIYEQNFRLMRWQIIQIIGTSNTTSCVEDFLQESALRLVRNVSQIRSQCLTPEQQRAYTLLTAKSVAINEWNRRKWREGWSYYSLEPEEVPDARNAIQAAEQRMELEAALGCLSETERDLLLYYYFLGEKRKYISQTMGFSEKAFYMRLSNARRHLQSCLERGNGR